MLVPLLIAAVAVAEEVSEAPDPGAPADEAPPLEVGEATEISGITKDQYAFLEPRRHRLPQNPYAQVDFTAYTLEWGEVLLGFAGTHFGLAPHVQVGTTPVLDLLGVYNGHLKANILRVGPVDLGLQGQYFVLPLGDFVGQFIGAGGMASWIVRDPVSLHLGAQYARVTAKGVPTAPPALFRGLVSEDDIEQLQEVSDTLMLDPQVVGNALFLRFAADVRFNRRDSLVLQVQTLAFGNLRSTLGDDIDDATRELIGLVIPASTEVERDERFRIGDAYAITLSWQFAWQQVGARFGGGWSADKYSWILQGNDLNYRFWGKTRLEDRRRKKGWRNSRRAVEEGAAPTDD